MWFLSGALILLAFFFVALPLMVYFTLKVPVGETWSAWDPEGGGMAKLASRSQEVVARELAPLGFEFLGGLQAKTPAIDVYELHCGHGEGTDTAAVSTMFLKTQKKERCFVEFRTDFEDGSLVTTSNGHLPDSPFAPPPGCHGFRFKNVDDLALLYRLHKQTIAHYAASKTPLRWDAELLVARRNAEEKRVVEAQVRRGLAKVEEGNSSPTLRGAVTMVWNSIFPLLHIRRATAARTRKKLLELASAA